MIDLRTTIIPKSDQLNADDLIGETRTIKVTKVLLTAEADQPVALNYEGDNGKPYKPCKSMRRVLVKLWGPDGNDFAGRRMTLYRDDKVLFGGMAVGGIRISHMSDIGDKEVTMALTAKRADRRPYTVRPLVEQRPKVSPAGTGAARSYAETLEAQTAAFTSAPELRSWWDDQVASSLWKELKDSDPAGAGRVREGVINKISSLEVPA